MVAEAVPNAAPEELETVTALLNSWLIPNDSRVPTDRFDDFRLAYAVPAAEIERLRRLRDDLRNVVERKPGSELRLNQWIRRGRVRPVVSDGRLSFGPTEGIVAEIQVSVLDAIVLGHWPRLKACPDCHWVFYDRSKNASKRWCLMTSGGSSGRSCGTIDKVRRFRQRQRSSQGAQLAS
jgi:predicted RNA-binding Zn ribbon-like protein